MKRSVIALAAGIIAAALAAGPAAAGHEDGAVSARSTLSDVDSAIREGVAKWVSHKTAERITKRCPEGTHESWEGDMGLVCRPDKSFSVTCQIIGWEKVVDDSGERLKPILGECDPKGGFGGDGKQEVPPQAP